MFFIQATYKRIYTYIHTYIYVCVCVCARARARVCVFIPSFFGELHQTLKLQLSYTNALR